VNLGTQKASVTVGQPGLSVNLSRRGVRATFGLPGTGLSSIMKQVGGSRRRGSLIEELFAVIVIVVLLGILKLIWEMLVGIVGAVLQQGPSRFQRNLCAKRFAHPKSMSASSSPSSFSYARRFVGDRATRQRIGELFAAGVSTASRSTPNRLAASSSAASMFLAVASTSPVGGSSGIRPVGVVYR